MTRQDSLLMWLLIAMFAGGGLMVLAGWFIPGLALLVLPLVAVWRLDR